MRGELVLMHSTDRETEIDEEGRLVELAPGDDHGDVVRPKQLGQGVDVRVHVLDGWTRGGGRRVVRRWQVAADRDLSFMPICQAQQLRHHARADPVVRVDERDVVPVCGVEA